MLTLRIVHSDLMTSGDDAMSAGMRGDAALRVNHRHLAQAGLGVASEQ